MVPLFLQISFAFKTDVNMSLKELFDISIWKKQKKLVVERQKLKKEEKNKN